MGHHGEGAARFRALPPRLNKVLMAKTNFCLTFPKKKRKKDLWMPNLQMLIS